MVIGCFELLLLIGIIAGFFILLGRYPRLGKTLFQTIRSRRFSGWQLLAAALVCGFIALLLFHPASKASHPLSKILFPLFYSAAIVLFLWAVLRFLGLPLDDDRP